MVPTSARGFSLFCTWSSWVREGYMYTLDRWFSNKFDPQGEVSQNWFWSLSRVLKKRKSNNQFQETTLISWFFHWDHQFLENSQEPRTKGYLNLRTLKNQNWRFWDPEDFQKKQNPEVLTKIKEPPCTGSNFHHFSWFCCKAPQPGSNFHLFWWSCWLCLSGKDYRWIHLVLHFQEHFLLELVGRNSWVLLILFLYAPK